MLRTMSTQAIFSSGFMDKTNTGWSKISRVPLLVCEPSLPLGLGGSQKISPLTAFLASLVTLLRLGIVAIAFLHHIQDAEQ